MNSAFNSAYYFKEWAVYSYGNSHDLWRLNWLHNDNLQLLNTHNLDCENYLNYEEYGFVGRIEKPITFNQFLTEIAKVIKN